MFVFFFFCFLFFFFLFFFFFSSRRRHTRYIGDWIQTCALPIYLKGTVVPAYAINALLGKIPLIGGLFTGSEKGGGLFAATYTMKGQGENVDISINPLSALAPGALRDIFTGSDKEQEIPAPKP